MVPYKRGGFKENEFHDAFATRTGTWKLLKDSFGSSERHKCDLPEVRHYSPSGSIKDDFCGQKNGDGNRDYNGAVMSFTEDWSKVTCKNCLAKKAREVA